ncbi:transposase, IS1341 family [Gloeothece citriformis PCC 7424]|uniref:Transposase, IS1341 family n=1 Tax=Gloeothece citriformis (strain PCC 7424) TaxID=65393 RepID=B7KBN6_GLOC7|nr:RNA-guided endonuclease TnpB family protein [Gloeothece citriformis]ACK73014.1 transposase, IS1341 family [Gloeothece citriformis PCC 7424]
MPEVQTITIACKLKVGSELAKEIDETFLTFAIACDWINNNTPVKLTNKTAMQSLVYQDVRAKFGLSSNLAIQALRRVCANRKTAKQKGRKVKEFSPTSVSYDARIFSFKESDWTVSLKLLHKRRKFELLIGNYHRGMLKGTNPTSATLVKRKNGDYYIHINLDKPVPEPIKTDDVIGVDLGRTDIAVTSEGDSWSGKQITDLRNHYAKMRAILQRKATKGTRTTRGRCRQLLKRLSGHEKRFQSWLNHCISRKLVDNAVANKKAIAIEDLTGIRERTNKKSRSKKDKRLGNNWAFYQLREYLTYKCLLAGVKLILVNPAYTSLTCHKCFVIGDRNGKKFTCSSCGTMDSDWNGSKNIAALGAIITRPRGTGLSCEIKREVQYIQLTLFDALGLPKTATSA